MEKENPLHKFLQKDEPTSQKAVTTTTSKKALPILILIVVLCMLITCCMVFGGVALASSGIFDKKEEKKVSENSNNNKPTPTTKPTNSPTKTPQTPSQTPTPTKSPAPNVAPVKNSVKTGEFNWKLIKVENMGQKIESKIDPSLSISTDQEFIKVTYSVTNENAEFASAIEPVLIDSANNQIATYAEQLFVMDINNGESVLFISLLDKGETEQYIAIYEVPKGSKNISLGVSDENGENMKLIDLEL